MGEIFLKDLPSLTCDKSGDESYFKSSFSLDFLLCLRSLFGISARAADSFFAYSFLLATLSDIPVACEKHNIHQLISSQKCSDGKYDDSDWYLQNLRYNIILYN